MTRTIDITTLAARHADGAFVLDVREPAEYVRGHVPGAVLAPLSRVTTTIGDLPKDRPVHVICQSGNRSRAVTDLLRGLGFEALNVEGGTSAWLTAGHAIVAGPHAA